MSDLKPCPFCGNHEPNLRAADRKPKRGRWVVICEHPFCFVEAKTFPGTKASVIKTWNRRSE